METVDLNQATFDEWLRLVFDRPVAKSEWFMKDDYDWKIDPTLLIQHSTQLFQHPAFLFERYSLEQIEQGFRFVPIVGELNIAVWDMDVPLPLRQECVHSMVNLFESVFMKNSLGDVAFMWWDSFRSFEDEPEWEMVEAVFGALSQIIRMESSVCWCSALHGLGHLNHPGKVALINDFLQTHPDVHPDTKIYALAAIEGRVL
ncbi:MAG TPA: hypothetical protein VFA21_15525 [Pyrinomonadaceae bacterium]|nr:hypothetical protein [Pyrinomonadaceae bacterium]